MSSDSNTTPSRGRRRLFASTLSSLSDTDYLRSPSGPGQFSPAAFSSHYSDAFPPLPLDLESRGLTSESFSPSRQSAALSGLLASGSRHALLMFRSTDTAPLSSASSDSASAASARRMRRVNLSPAPPSDSPTRSRSPWPPPSEADSEELEVEQNLEPSEEDLSLLEEEILASLHSHTLDPQTFTRHALSHISEANESSRRTSMLSRGPSVSAPRGVRPSSPTSLLSSDYGGNAVR